MKTEPTALARQREIKRREERKRIDKDLYIIFLIFCCGPRMCSFAGSIFTTLQRVWDSFVELTPK